MKSRLLILFITIVSSIHLFISCGDKAQSASLEFYYYPARNIYYNPLSTTFYYSLNGGKSWDSIQGNLPGGTNALGEKKIIKSTTADVWIDNELHRKEFNGVLYNIYNNDSTLSPANTISDKKVVRKGPVIQSKEPAKPEKRKFRKFMDKIFGKKKKQ